jgi:cell pole-organizing protein PopZ
MTPRRKLIEGIKPDPAIENAFVYADQRTPPAPPEAPAAAAAPDEAKATAKAITRAPLTTRVRAEFAAALKRASLERQLQGITPNTLQDILEEALEPWLRKNGYLS